MSDPVDLEALRRLEQQASPAPWDEDELCEMELTRPDARLAVAMRNALPALLERFAQPPEEIARRFHEAYERLAPEFGYETRRASAVPWEKVPEANRKLMVAVVRDVFG